MKLTLPFLTCICFLLSCGDHDRVNITKAEAKPIKKDSVSNKDSINNKLFLDKTLANAKASVSGETAEIEAYVSIILDSSSSKTLKYRAFRALHDHYPNAFTNIKDVKKTAEKVEAALIRQAQIKAVKEKITELNQEEVAKK